MDELENFNLAAFSNDVEKRFVADSNEVVHMKLVRNLKDIDREDGTFKPEMSHQVFSKTEKIFGYNDLNIKLYYTAGSLRTYVNVSFKEKIDPSVIGLPADNVSEMITQFLEHEYFENVDLFAASIKDEVNFKPAGVLLDSFSANESKYEIYHVHLTNTDSKFLDNYYQRLQRFLIWYVDGASFVDVDDDKWNYFIMYEKYLNENQEYAYGVVAFGTVYEYYAYPSHIRPRISQLLVLPPFQKKGLAAYLINCVYKHYIDMQSVVDITVEDPTEDCQAIRDFVDLCRCEKLNYFTDEKLKEGYTKAIEEELKTKLKIHKKQARRLYEIMLLRSINKSDENQYKKYRLQVKKRLNTPFQKMNSTMRRMNHTFKPQEIEEASVLQKPEVRYESLTRQYNDLEDQYERVLQRFENGHSFKP